MSEEFNDLERASGVYALSEYQNINKFECIIKEVIKISYYTQSSNE